MSGYGQFCPVAKAMELLDERWTLLVVRELLLGSRHFNDLRRGVPKMSPALLSKRLKSLTRAGVVQRDEIDGRTTYSLTRVRAGTRHGRRRAGLMGCALDRRTRRARSRPAPADVGHPPDDPPRRLAPVPHHAGLPTRGVAPKASRWWLVVAEGEADVCDFDPGYEPAGTVQTSLRTLTRIWRGDVGWSHALLDGSVAVSGPADVRRAIPSWIGQGSLAAVPRPA